MCTRTDVYHCNHGAEKSPSPQVRCNVDKRQKESRKRLGSSCWHCCLANCHVRSSFYVIATQLDVKHASYPLLDPVDDCLTPILGEKGRNRRGALELLTTRAWIVCGCEQWWRHDLSFKLKLQLYGCKVVHGGCGHKHYISIYLQEKAKPTLFVV